MRSHLRQAQSCSWWIPFSKSGEHLVHAPVVDEGSEEDMQPAQFPCEEMDGEEGSEDGDEEKEAGDGDVSGDGDETAGDGDDETSDEEDDAGEVFREWLEQAQTADLFEPMAFGTVLGEAGPGPSTQRVRMANLLGARVRYLDDDDDDDDNGHVYDEHAKAGVVLRMSHQLHERWASLFGTNLKLAGVDDKMDGSGAPDLSGVEWYRPFASELDWKVAKWMVNEGIGHNAFNELLAIPGVRC